MDAGIASLAATRAGGGGVGLLGESDPARAAAKETNGGCWQKKKQANNPNQKLEKKNKEHMVEIK